MPALSSIAIAAAIGSAAIGTVGAIQSGQAAKSQANFQSAVMGQEAVRAQQDAAAKEQDFRNQQSRALATRRANLGGAGIDPSQGSALLVDQDFAGESELQALRIRNGGDVAATRLQENAALTRSAGNNAVTSSYFRAGSSLLSGAGSAYNLYSRTGSGGVRSSNAFGPDAYE